MGAVRFVVVGFRSWSAGLGWNRARGVGRRGWRRLVAVAAPLVLVSAGAVVLAGVAQARTAVTVYVSIGGSDSADCHQATPCSTVSRGVAAAQTAFGNDASHTTDVTVSVAPGSYSDHVTIAAVPTGDTLTLAGHTAGDTTINGGGTGTVVTADVGVVTISGLTLTGGSSFQGGGIRNAGTLTVTSSTLSGNAAANGGGGGIFNSFNATLTVSHSTLSGNSTTKFGGGIYNDLGATVTMDSSTLSGNTASSGGAIYDRLDAGTVTVSGSTLSGNTATNGGGIQADAPVNLSASILSASPCNAPVTDEGYNVASDHSCVSAGGSSVVDSASIGLGALAANGSSGPLTQAIPATSSAHQVVPTSKGLCAATDERGGPRPGVSGASGCDAGAFELQTTIMTTTTLASSANPSLTGQSVTFTATVAPTTGTGTATGTVTFRDGATPLGTRTLSGGTATFTAAALSATTHPITASYGGNVTLTGSNSQPLAQVVQDEPSDPLLVSQLRLQGPGANTGDQFVELYNNAGTRLSLSGWSMDSVYLGGAAVTLALPAVTLPPGGHFLIAGPAYSLAAYVAPDLTLSTPLAPDEGVAVIDPFGTPTEAAGMSSADGGFFEGTGLTRPDASGSAQLAYVRTLAGGVVTRTTMHPTLLFESTGTPPRTPTAPARCKAHPTPTTWPLRCRPKLWPVRRCSHPVWLRTVHRTGRSPAAPWWCAAPLPTPPAKPSPGCGWSSRR